MDDKDVIPQADSSEYKFAESEVGGIDTADTAEQLSSQSTNFIEDKKPGFKFSLKDVNLKRFIGPGSIVLAIIFVYFAFNLYSAKKTKSVEQKKAMMQQQAAMIQQAAVPVSVQPVAPIGSNMSIDNDQKKQVQNEMQQKVDSMLQQLASDEERISSLRESVEKTTQDISSINQKIEQLTAMTQQMLLEIEKIKTLSKVVKKKPKKLPVAYHIRAVVPGRVWLESADGDNVSLRVGDKLEGYGEVKVISPDQGRVVMSNGSIIQYGINDF